MAQRVPYRSKLPRTREGRQLQKQIEGVTDAVTGTRFALDGAQRVTLGFVALFPAAITPQKGWLHCDGSAIDRQEYSALFRAVGTTLPFGPGDGSTTFELPDLGTFSPPGFEAYIWAL